MNEKNVIRFHAEHKFEAACTEADILDLVKWRSKLYMEGLVGQDPARYEGLGFGNLSQKISEGTYLITGSQTGHLENLTLNEFAKITGFDPAENQVWSVGMSRPSSETMTHLAVYQNHPDIRHVFHVHCPEIWLARKELKIPATDSRAECGTVELYHEVQRLLEKRENFRKGILAMGGHVDGILVWGESADEAGFTLLSFLTDRPKAPVVF